MIELTREDRAAAGLAMGEGWPVLGTALVVGTTFGVVARQAGLEPPVIVTMSVLVFAGAAQFVMVQLLGIATPPVVIVATVLFLNLRHLLMAASLRTNLGRLPLAQRLVAAYFLTDESFAMATSHFSRGGRSVTYYFTFAIALFFVWNLATVAGMLLGGAIGDPRRLGVDFAITATFIGIVVLAVRRPVDILIALIAAAVAAALALAGASAIAVIVAGATAPLLAVAVRR